MFTLFEPSDAQIEDFLVSQKDLPFSYKQVGASQTAAIPAGYPVNHHRVHWGDGADAFARAKDAIQSWTMYKLPGRGFVRRTRRSLAAKLSARLSITGFCWSINPCRIIYVSEKSEEKTELRIGFGTLPGHSEEGEERFTVERRRADEFGLVRNFVVRSPARYSGENRFSICRIFPKEICPRQRTRDARSRQRKK